MVAAGAINYQLVAAITIITLQRLQDLVGAIALKAAAGQLMLRLMLKLRLMLIQ